MRFLPFPYKLQYDVTKTKTKQSERIPTSSSSTSFEPHDTTVKKKFHIFITSLWTHMVVWEVCNRVQHALAIPHTCNLLDVMFLRSVPLVGRVLVDGILQFILHQLDRLLGQRPGAARGDAEIERHIVTLADAAGRKPEPVGKDATALVVRIVGEQPVQSVLLLAATALAAVHLLQLVRALLPVHVLLEGIQVQQCEHLPPGIVGPERCDYLLLHWASVTRKQKQNEIHQLRARHDANR